MKKRKTGTAAGASTIAARPDKPSDRSDSFKLSKNMTRKLPESEKEGAAAHLWAKSGGLCALCGLPLGADVDPDHRIPEASNGKTQLSNLYLAHKACNASRQDLRFDLAQPIVAFKVFAEAKQSITFDTVLERYLDERNKDVKFQFDATRAVLDFNHATFEARLLTDPATGVKYFFAEVPAEFIHNDREIQPRNIMHAHVRKLAIDFATRPVHEPSNCRFIGTGAASGRLLQFDGQHKTTAQLILGRRMIPMKIYVNPEIPMLQELVVKIQQEIKKQPLSKSDTVAKLSAVLQRRLEQYAPKGGPRTERGFIEAQPKEDRKEAKQLYFQELEKLVFFDDENQLRKQLMSPDGPTTDKVVFGRIIAPLLYHELLDVDMDAAGGRDLERQNVLLVLNTIASAMLSPGWNGAGNTLQKRRATNFFYQGAIGWWMKEILIPTLRYVLFRIQEKKPLFLDKLDSEQEASVINAVEKLCAWDIWSTEDSEHLKAMRSNTVQNVVEAFPSYDAAKLMKEAAKS